MEEEVIQEEVAPEAEPIEEPKSPNKAFENVGVGTSFYYAEDWNIQTFICLTFLIFNHILDMMFKWSFSEYLLLWLEQISSLWLFSREIMIMTHLEKQPKCPEANISPLKKLP